MTGETEYTRHRNPTTSFSPAWLALLAPLPESLDDRLSVHLETSSLSQPTPLLPKSFRLEGAPFLSSRIPHDFQTRDEVYARRSPLSNVKFVSVHSANTRLTDLSSLCNYLVRRNPISSVRQSV